MTIPILTKDPLEGLKPIRFGDVKPGQKLRFENVPETLYTKTELIDDCEITFAGPSGKPVQAVCKNQDHIVYLVPDETKEAA